MGMFSVQEAMNCQVLPEWSYCEDDTDDSNCVSDLAQGFVGTWGGESFRIINWLVANESEMSLVQTSPFTGIQGTCDTSAPSMPTGVKGYSSLETKAEMKNAIYYHGDISVTIVVSKLFRKWKPTEDVSWPHFFGKGMSIEEDSQSILLNNHAVNIIGWGPCLVPQADDDNLCGTDISVMIIGECWIIQNSWGSKKGYNGYYFVNTDRNCDQGVHFEAIVPIHE